MKRRRGFGHRRDLNVATDLHGQGASWGSYGRHGQYSGLDAESMSPQVRVVAALAVLVPVALSGVVLAFTPVWWIFTTYGWVVFPALGLLARGVAGLSGRPLTYGSAASKDAERELLEALRTHGELSAVLAATATSLKVAEADAMLKELAEAGHLEARVRGGGFFYASWGSGTGEDEAPRGEDRGGQRSLPENARVPGHAGAERGPKVPDEASR